jgi:uncharacterized protein (TIRG00374 family)
VTDATATPVAPTRRRGHRLRGILRLVVGLAFAAVAIWVVTGKRSELEGALSYLSHLRWQWVVIAAAAELFAIVSFGAMQRQLLAAGGVPLSLGMATSIAFAGNAIQNSLPAGPLWSNVWAFRQFRRRGADDVLAVWTLFATSVLSAVALAGVAAMGLLFARNEDLLLDLALVAGAGVLLLVILRQLLRRHRWTLAVAARAIRLSQRLVRRPPGDARQLVERGWERLTAVTPSRPTWALGLSFAAANWLWDAMALALAFAAVGSGIPWRSLLLAYGAAQLAINLPITPGGLGVVEGSLTIALVAYGGNKEATVATVVLYRLISFWGLLALGWIAWAALGIQARRSGLTEETDA